MMRKAIRNMIGRIRFQRAATVLPALLLITAGMSSCSENEDVNDVPVPTAKGTGVEFALGMAGWNESGAEPHRDARMPQRSRRKDRLTRRQGQPSWLPEYRQAYA